MDPYQIATELYSREPQPANTIQWQLQDMGDVTCIFEILSILVAEYVEKKLKIVLRGNKSLEQFIDTLKEYFRSFGMKLECKEVKTIPHVPFKNFFTFQVNQHYSYAKFGTKVCRTVNNTKYNSIYIPGMIPSKNLNEYILCVNDVTGHYFEINFHYL